MLKNNLKKKLIILALLIFPFLCLFFSLFLGRYPISASMILKVLANKIFSQKEKFSAIYETIIWEVRLPRALLGMLVGASLAVSGTAFQGLFRNPLISSGILGVSAGAGFGASLAIILFNNPLMIYSFAFLGGITAVLLSYLIGRIYNSTPTIMLILGGVIVASIFSALISFLKYMADPYEDLPSIVFWLMGSLATARFNDIIISAIPMLIGIIGLLLIKWRINILSMGDKEAQTLGLNINFNKGLVIFCATIATAGAVCVSGIIGWVGLVIPHIGRMLIGNDNKFLIPISLSLGGCFLVLVDNLARIVTGSEIPLGILTALLGGPFFVYLLKKTKGGGW